MLNLWILYKGEWILVDTLEIHAMQDKLHRLRVLDKINYRVLGIGDTPY